MTNLKYDRQLVRYAQLLKIKQASALLQPQSSIEPPADGFSHHLGAKVGRPESGKKLVARDLNIPEQAVRRAYQTASLSPEAAIETGLDDNRSALLEAAKERTPEAQTATIRRLAGQTTVPPEPSSESPKSCASVAPLATS